jgi:hypothetical protein
MIKIFGREPALWLALIAGVVQSLTAFGVNVSPGVQTAVNAVAAGVVAVILAVVLKSGAIAAALMQLAAGGMALVVGLGLNWGADRQSIVMSAVAVLISFFTRTQVTAPVPETAVERKVPTVFTRAARR